MCYDFFQNKGGIMKNAKTLFLLFTCSAISFTLIAKNKERAQEQPVFVQDEDFVEEEEFLATAPAQEEKDSPLPIEGSQIKELAHAMYFFETTKNERNIAPVPSKEIRDACKALDAAQYPNGNKKILDKIQGIKSWIRIASVKQESEKINFYVGPKKIIEIKR